jgi:hypothetical protein
MKFKIYASFRNGSSIHIGFCDQQFSLEGEWLGWNNNSSSNSIGFGNKIGIWFDGSRIEFGNVGERFKKLDLIGVGIIQYPKGKMECFATCNGKFLGKY